MQRGLEICTKQLKEVEDKLIASLKENPSDQFIITEALSFVQEAQKALSKTQAKIGLLPAQKKKGQSLGI